MGHHFYLGEGFPWMLELKPERKLINNYKEIGEKTGLKYDE
jgi:hypothetical protein